MKIAKTPTAAGSDDKLKLVKKQSGNTKINANKNQMIDQQISNFEQHKAIKILHKETHIQNLDQREFLSSYLRRHVQQFKILEGDPMEFLMSLTLNLKYVFYPKGKVIFHENDNIDDLFFILDGDVQFYSRKSEEDIKTEKFWQQQVQQKQQLGYNMTIKDHQRIRKDEDVLSYYKCEEDELLFKKSKKKNMYFLNDVLLFKKTYQRNKGETFGVDEKDNSQTAVAKTDLVLAVTSQTNYIQSYAKYKEKNVLTFECLKKFIAPLINQQPNRIDDKTLRDISCKTTASLIPIHDKIIDQIEEIVVRDLPSMNQKQKSELGLNEYLYVVKSGIVEYYQNYESTEKKGIKLMQLNEGDIFGHECFLRPEKQRFTVIAAAPQTHILSLKKDYIMECQTLYDIIQIRGQQFYNKLYVNISSNPYSKITISSPKMNFGKYDGSPSQQLIKRQSQNQVAEKSKQSIESQSKKQILSNKQIQQSQNQINVNSANNQPNTLNIKQIQSPSSQQSKPKSQQIISTSLNQIKINSFNQLNVPQSARRKESVRINQDDFEGSFDYLEDMENTPSTSRIKYIEQRQQMEKYKQKSRIILNASSCAQIPETKQSPIQQNSNEQIAQVSPFLQVPSPQTHRKSLSTHASPISKYTLKVNNESSPNQQMNLMTKLNQIAKERIEELKLSPQKVITVDSNDIYNLKSYLKQQRNAKIPPSRQPDEFRIKNNMFDNSTQASSIVQYTKDTTNDCDGKLSTPPIKRMSAPLNIFQENINVPSIQNYMKQTPKLVDLQQIQSNYFSCDQLNPSRELSQIDKLISQQVSNSNEDNCKNDIGNGNRSSFDQPQLNLQTKPQFKISSLKNPMLSPPKTFEKLQSPNQKHYLNFKEKYLNNLHSSRQKGPSNLMAN